MNKSWQRKNGVELKCCIYNFGGHLATNHVFIVALSKDAFIYVFIDAFSSERSMCL